MRLFIALDLPKNIKDELFSIQNKITNQNAKISWVPKKNLHLTLKFLGQVNIDPVIIKERLDKINFEKFFLNIGDISYFLDNKSLPRVIFVSVFPKEEIINLQKKIDSELLDLFPGDQKFSPHITLGRVKLVKNKTNLFKSLEETKFTNLSFLNDSFVLKSSKVTKDGSNYNILWSFNNNL